MTTALDGVTVLDLTTGLSGAYAGKLLADLGAEVVMVEPPGGSPLRARPPLAAGAGLLFDHLAGAKRSVVPADRDEAALVLDRLAWRADVVLTDTTSPWEACLPTTRPDHVVEVQLSPFGRTGPYAGWAGSDLATWAMGGYCYFTGYPDREPLWIPGSQSSFHAGTHGAFAALAGLYERRRSGWGQAVEVSDLEAVLAAHAWLVTSWQGNGLLLPRVPCDLVRAADGWVYFMRIAPSENLFVLIERFDMADEGLTVDVQTWFANIPRVFEAVAEWAADKNVADIVEAAQSMRVAVTPVLDARGVREDPQLAARDWFERDAPAGPAFPGQPYHLSATPSSRRGPAPALGADTEAYLAWARDSYKVRNERPARAATAHGPLTGLRVIEVTNNWAGPVAGRHLADLGADVIKVEWAAKPATRALYWPGPTQHVQRQGHHRAMYFNEMNRNKRDVVIDLSKPEGRDVLVELVKTADVLIENNSARVMPNLGLGWEQLRAVNPRLVMVSMSGYGASGPRRDWVAYGSNIETTSGLTCNTGYPDGMLSRTTLFYADPVSGIHAAVAVLAALENRRRTGEGQWVEIALNETGAAFGAEALLHYEATGEVRAPAGNRDPRFAPHGIYRCIGTDNWVAIAVQADAQWPDLARAIGRDDLADDPGLATLEGRQARHDELDEAIAAYTVQFEQYEVAWKLQQLGVSAAPVLANWQMLPDPHLHQRGIFVDVEHPVVGVYKNTSWPWHFSRTPGRVTRPAPLFSEHNREVLAEAGLDGDAIEALYAAGVTADDPAV